MQRPPLDFGTGDLLQKDLDRSYQTEQVSEPTSPTGPFLPAALHPFLCHLVEN